MGDIEAEHARPGGIHPNDFRAAAGRFPTGVAVVTTLDVHGRPVGITVNSFATVSLDPPMVLFSLGLEADSNAAFDAGPGYVVNVLSADQQDLSVAFATLPTEDRFGDVAWSAGHAGMPVLDGVLAAFHCEWEAVHPGGDHRIMVGRVVRLDLPEQPAPALGYFRSGYVRVGGEDEADSIV